MQVDLKAEGAYGHCPCNSMWNNPISNADPNGDFAFMTIMIGAFTGGVARYLWPSASVFGAIMDGPAGFLRAQPLGAAYLGAWGLAVGQRKYYTSSILYTGG